MSLALSGVLLLAGLLLVLGAFTLPMFIALEVLADWFGEPSWLFRLKGPTYVTGRLIEVFKPWVIGLLVSSLMLAVGGGVLCRSSMAAQAEALRESDPAR